MGPIAREGFPLGPNRGAYILAKESFRAVVFWMPVDRGIYANLKVAIWAQWQGRLSKRPV